MGNLALDNFNVNAMPLISQAITRAENDPTGMHGVRSMKTANPTQVLQNSVMNNFNRWSSGKTPAPWINERPTKFIDFMQRRWAPVGAENDPKGLNQNWAPNVRSILLQMLGPEKYKEWEALNIVQANGGQTYA